MDSTRLTQFGTWEGVDHRRRHARRRSTPRRSLGVRDRSWGIRPVGEPRGRRARHAAAVLLALGADQLRRRLHALRRQRGRRRAALARERQHRAASADRRADRAPWTASTIASAGSPARAARPAPRSTLTPARRRAAGAITLEPILTFQMRGLGYLHPGVGPRHVEGRRRRSTASRGRSPTSTRWSRATSTSSSSAARASATARASASSSSS